MRTAQLNLRDSAIRAPMEGIIQTRTIETGQYVQAGFVMATLLRNDPMLLRFQVEPPEAPRIKSGAIATFTLRETQRTFNAKVTLVAGSADAATHMIGVTAEIADEGHKYWLRPGSFCDVTMNLGALRDAPMIPRSAARAPDHGSSDERVRGAGESAGTEAVLERGSVAVNITDISIKNPVFAWMMMASTILFGIIAVSRIGISQWSGG